MITNSNIHWNYFISIEDDLNRLSRFIEFDKNNENVFSIELVRLLLSSSSEFEVVSKEICLLKRPGEKVGNFREKLFSIFPILPDLELIIPRYNLNNIPLENWKSNKDADWWTSYNLVKHMRQRHFELANLKNVIESIGALYIINLFYYNSLQEQNNGKNVPMEETTLELYPRPCLLKVNRPDFYMIPYCKSY